MSSRRITDVQFSAGTTADGSRIDRAMQEAIDRFNAVPPGDMGKRHTQHQLVMGWQPAVNTLQNNPLPYCPIYNSALTLATGTAAPDEGYQNPWRVKGAANPNIDPTNATIVDEQWLWTTAMVFSQPVILDGVSLFFLHDTSYLNNFVFGNPPPTGKVNGEPVDDIFMEVSVDCPFLLENRTQNAVEFSKTRWRVDAEQFCSQALPVGFVDMQPNHPTGGPVGIAVNALELNIPLPAGARVRFSIVIPQYRTTMKSSWQSGLRMPWGGHNTAATLTFLDSVQAG